VSAWLDSELIESQVEMIDGSQKEVKEAKEQIRDFILSDDFLVSYRSFELKLSTWTDRLMTLVEAVESGFSALGETGEPRLLGRGLSDRVESGDLTLMKGVLLCIAIIGSVLLVVFARVPWVVSLVVVLACLVCAFFDKIGDFVRSFFSHEEEEELVSTNALTASISENLDYIRRTYESARFLVKHQKSCSQVFNKQLSGVDDALFDREKQLLEDLPHDFIGRIDSISLSTNSVAFKCKFKLLSLRHKGPDKADASVKRNE